MFRLCQKFDDTQLVDLESAVDHAMNESGVHLPAGKEIAISAGSRGIYGIDRILKRVADRVKQAGAIPFIVPAMGSHGGATAAGQRGLLAELGITEDSMDCEIRSSMDTVQLAQDDCPLPVYFDRNASEAAGTIVVNRIKAHTAFHGDYESGLVKMMAIGLGKHPQALAIHSEGTPGFVEMMPQVARQVLKHGNVLMGLGIVENAYDKTLAIKGLSADQILDQEPALLQQSKACMPGLPLNEIDILIVDRMGKNLSGTGMDGNIIGRMGVPGFPDPAFPRIRAIVVRDLTSESHGNALGVGLADVTTRRLFDQIDFKPMYENLFTSTYLPRGKIPVVCETDWEAIAFAARSVTGTAQRDLKIVRIDSTLHLETVHVSQAALNEMRLQEQPQEIANGYFDEKGGCLPL